jgi:hypothetical protein
VAVPTHLKIVPRGIFAGSPEQWSFSVKFNRQVAGGTDLDVDSIDETDMTTALTGLLNNSSFAGGVKCTEWRAYQIGSDGLTVGTPRLFAYAPGAEPQGSSGTKQPSQISLAITTVGAARGPARFGRFYLPGPSKVVGSDWRLSADDANAYLALAVQFVKDVSTAIHVGLGADSQEMLNISNIGTGTRQVVDHLEVGRVLDTIRKRRAQLLEDRQVSGHIDW